MSMCGLSMVSLALSGLAGRCNVLQAGTAVSIFDMVANCITFRGSFIGTRQELAEALAFAAQTSSKPLSAINNVLERLDQGNLPSRVILGLVGG